MSDTTYSKIFSGSFIIVQLAMDRLKSAGINAILKDESQSSIIGFGTKLQGYQELYVNDEELDLAQSIIASVKAELESQ
ncbi:MAG: DUF2007 domain-containing protein [Psychroserpens sp.]|uniref:putative signal transducing protein n=1 Tax=Psychroserpens sp. TaxID=2020870 RepID=UPI003002BD5B